MDTKERRLGTAVLTVMVWRGEVIPVDDAGLAAALREADRNQVQGLLARAYPQRLPGLVRAVDVATAQFRDNLAAVTARLRDAGVLPVLIKADPEGDYLYTNFDLVVGDQSCTGWSRGSAFRWCPPHGWLRAHPRHPKGGCSPLTQTSCVSGWHMRCSRISRSTCPICWRSGHCWCPTW